MWVRITLFFSKLFCGHRNTHLVNTTVHHDSKDETHLCRACGSIIHRRYVE